MVLIIKYLITLSSRDGSGLFGHFPGLVVFDQKLSFPNRRNYFSFALLLSFRCLFAASILILALRLSILGPAGPSGCSIVLKKKNHIDYLLCKKKMYKCFVFFLWCIYLLPMIFSKV